MHFYFVLIFCIPFITNTAAEEFAGLLTDLNFESKVTEYDTVLIMFYTLPFCRHCEEVDKYFEKAANELDHSDPPIKLFKVDCQRSGEELCKQYNVETYPTLKIFRFGKYLQDFENPKSAEDILGYMKTYFGSTLKIFNTVEEMKEFMMDQNEPWVVSSTILKQDHQKVFAEVVEHLKGQIRFAQELESPGKVDQPIIAVYRPAYLRNKFEHNFSLFTGENFTVENITDFVVGGSHGLVGHRKADNINDFQKPLIIAYYNIDYDKDPKGTNYWRNRILKVAKIYEDQVNFAVSSRNEFQYELKDFSSEKIHKDKPLVVAFDDEYQKFLMEDNFTVESLTKFVENFINDQLKPFVKSEPIPEKNDGPVKIAVAKTFDDIVTNNGKDTLVEFYAPWCGHCRNLAPVFDELGEKMKNEDIAVVKMNADDNDVPLGYDVRGYPTIYWALREKKDEPVLYNGGRKIDDFVKYISEHATDELKGYDRNGNEKVVKVEL